MRIPPQAEVAVHRERLIDALENGLYSSKLTLISAPAGYGKTTTLAQWARSSHFKVVWLSLDKEDNDVERFLRYLQVGWAHVQPEISKSRLGLLLEAMSPDVEAIPEAFINTASETTNQLVFVLDDYHLIEDESIHKLIAYLLEHLPENLHFVLVVRGEPPLPLARYRARGELLELDARDLCFTAQETGVFLDKMKVELHPEEIDSLQAQTEGWIAGIQLVALSLKRQLTDVNELFVSGQQRFIADYLREDVLADLGEEVQSFLVQTSILDRLCAPLCNALTGGENGQRMLELLESESLFLIPLDDRREWYRYHGLFADYLRKKLERQNPEEVRILHQRAGSWYLANDLSEQAFRHAVEGKDVQLVLRIFERYAQPMLIGGEFRLLGRWLDSLPQAWNAEHPMIGLLRTGLLLLTGQLDACIRYVEDMEHHLVSLDEENQRSQLARVTAVRCSIACFQNDLQRAEELAEQAFQDLPEEDQFFHTIIFGSLGDIYRRHGRWNNAKESYLKLLQYIHEPSFRVQSAHIFGALADLELRQGHLQDAERYWRQALGAIQDKENWGRLPLPLIGWVYIRMGELLYERNALEEAWGHVQRGLERAEIGGDVRAMIAGYLIAGRLALTRGDKEMAADYLENARPLVMQAQFAHWSSRFERLQLELWLAESKLRAAVGWADNKLHMGSQESQLESQVAQLAMARVLIVKGDEASLVRALALLETLLQNAEAEHRMGVGIEALALQALAHDKRGKTTDAMTSLEQSLRMAEGEGYVRRFVDLGIPMGNLLQEARSRHVMTDYVDRLLEALGDMIISADSRGRALPEALTAREEEVLELLAAGLTNREIAERLVISPETVKKHAGNIYGKLDVGSRSEAVARGRELDLLD